MTSYQEAAKYLESGRDRNDRPYGNNTRIVKRDDGIAVKLHATDVATFLPDGGVRLNSGGWRTVTTKDRMQGALPSGWHLYSQKGNWFLHFGNWENNDDGHLYAENVTVWPAGRIEGAGKQTDKAREDKLRKRIGVYSKAFAAKVTAGEVGLPGAGDCFYCGMKEVESGQPLGDVMSDTSHLESHLREKYYVPSLVFNAFEHGQSIAMKSSLYAKCSGDAAGDWKLSYFERNTAKSIRKYLLRRFGLSA